ncbi:MAG: hypothetical protein AAGI71_00125 [Bacteroidota bacterium]
MGAAPLHRVLRPLVQAHLHWAAWEARIHTHGFTIERPRTEPHPAYTHIIYPLDYGYVNGTPAPDGDDLDLFVGTAPTGLVGAILTTDHHKGDREVKLLYCCTPAEVYCAHGFINYDRTLLEGELVLRRPMHALWAEVL